MTMGPPDVIPDHDRPRGDDTPEHSPERARKRRLLPALQLVAGAGTWPLRRRPQARAVREPRP